MKFTSVLALIATLTAAVSAAPTGENAATSNGYTPFYITSPIGGGTFAPGSDVKATWVNGLPQPAIISVITGPSPTEMQPTNMEIKVDGNSGKYTWHVPETISDGVYAFKFSYQLDGKDGESYSSPFNIERKTTEPGSSAASSSGANDEKTGAEQLAAAHGAQ